MSYKKSENGVGLEYLQVVTRDSEVHCYRCGHCNKFIKKTWSHFYCPHCTVPFLDGYSIEELQEVEDLNSYVQDLLELIQLYG